MKIAIVSPFSESVPPAKYGGTELVVSNITENLVTLGHEVVLFAPAGSKTKAKLVETLPRSLRSMNLKNAQYGNAVIVTSIGKIAAKLAQENFDVIHNHVGWRLLSLEQLIKTPIVTTLHGPLNDDYQNFIYSMYKKSNFISISLSQRKPMPELNFVANVYNGIEIDRFPFVEKPQGDYFAFLGRMSPEKGPLQAIMAAKAANVKLIMAAKVDAVDRRYFEEQIQPLVDGKQIKFIGEVDHQGKVELLSNAKALLALIQWEEPFGLFFVESLVCGTPVIATNRGSVPELIKHGETGFICDNEEKIIQSIDQIDRINRAACSNYARENFSAVQMTKGYLSAYKKIIS